MMTTGDFDPGDAGAYSEAPRPTRGRQPGPLGLRFVARLIDGIIVGLVGFLLAVLFHVSGDILITGLFSGLLTFIYFVAFEVTQGWTPAKKLFNLSVHGPGGAPKPSLQQSAIRNAFTLLAIIPCRRSARLDRLHRDRDHDPQQPHQAGQARRTGRRHPGGQGLSGFRSPGPTAARTPARTPTARFPSATTT